MNRIELERALKTLRLGGICQVLDARILQAQTEGMAHIDFLSLLVEDELQKRQDSLLKRRITLARFRDAQRTLDTFDFDFNRKINRKAVFELATCRFVDKHEDILFLGQPGTGKSHLAQAIGLCAIHQGQRVIYRETHALIEEILDATLDGTRKRLFIEFQKADLLIIDDLGMRKLPPTAAEDLLEIVMRRHERRSTILTSNRPVEDWGKMLGDTAAVSALLDRLLHRGHVINCGPRSFRSHHLSTLKQEGAVG